MIVSRGIARTVDGASFRSIEARPKSLLWPLIALAIFACTPGGKAQSITIDVDRSTVLPIATNLSGANISSPDSPENFGDPAVQTLARSLQPGILRWPGGTVDDFFDWSTGLIPPPAAGTVTPIDVERALFAPFPTTSFNNQVQKATDELQPILAAKGGNPLGDLSSGFAGFATAIGAKFVVVVNTTTNTVDAAERLGFTIAKLKLPVTGFELANEPFFLVIPAATGAIVLPKGAPQVLGAYVNGVDYLTRVKPYYTAIKQGYAAAGVDPAQAVVAIAGGFASDTSDWNLGWMRDLTSYTYSHGAYWDAVAFHFYPPQSNGGGFDQAMVYANDALASGTAPFMTSYRAANWSRGKPLFLSEFDVTLKDRSIIGTVYAGIFCAEYVARMSVYPETANIMMHELLNSTDGIGVPKDAIAGYPDWKAALIDAGKSGKAIPTLGHVKGLFFNTQILGDGLASAAINKSIGAYATKLSGALGTVPTRTAVLPAVYAQAYRGLDQSIHVLITNKSPDSKLAVLVIDGQKVSATITVDTLQPSAGDPSQRNTADTQPISIAHKTVNGAVTIPGYSVTHLRLVALSASRATAQ